MRTIKPFYYPTKYLGLLPFNLKKNGVQVLSIKVIPVVFMYLLNLSNHWFRFSVTVQFTQGTPVLLILGTYMTSVCFLFNTTANFVKGFINRHKLHKLLVKFVKVDEKIMRLGVKLNYRQHFIFTTIAVSIFAAGFARLCGHARLHRPDRARAAGLRRKIPAAGRAAGARA